METSIFNYGELPEFEKFTSDKINQEFPNVIEKINLDFKNIENFLSHYLDQEKLDWDKVINPLNEVNEILRWSWGVISHLNGVNNSESLRDVYAKKSLSQIPRMLGNMDRNRFSPTYGCFHRDFWLSTDYSGWNPDVSQFGNVAVGGSVDTGPYPMSKALYFNVSVGL